MEVSTEGVNWIGLTEDIYKFNFLSSWITNMLMQDPVLHSQFSFL